MSTCYLCGSDSSHTYDCPKFSSSFILSNPAPEPIVTFKIKDKVWRIDVIKPGDMIPKWVTHVWYVDGYELGNKGLTLQQRAEEWEKFCINRRLDTPLHTAKARNLEIETIYNSNRLDLIIFGPV